MWAKSMWPLVRQEQSPNTELSMSTRQAIQGTSIIIQDQDSQVIFNTHNSKADANLIYRSIQDQGGAIYVVQDKIELHLAQHCNP
jgi:hypothetical protein